VIKSALAEHVPGARCARLDGQTPGDDRLRVVTDFNTNEQVNVLLMSKVRYALFGTESIWSRLLRSLFLLSSVAGSPGLFISVFWFIGG